MIAERLWLPLVALGIAAIAIPSPSQARGFAGGGFHGIGVGHPAARFRVEPRRRQAEARRGSCCAVWPGYYPGYDDAGGAAVTVIAADPGNPARPELAARMTEERSHGVTVVRGPPIAP